MEHWVLGQVHGPADLLIFDLLFQIVDIWKVLFFGIEVTVC